MLDYSGCWQWFQFLIKYINYEILLQRIASLCPTREWFVLQLTGELYRVHLQLIRKEGEGAGRRVPLADARGPCGAKAGRKIMLQPKPQARREDVCSIRCLCGPPCRRSVCDILDQGLWTLRFFNTCSHLKGHTSATSASKLSISTPSSRKPSVIPSDVQSLNQLH